MRKFEIVLGAEAPPGDADQLDGLVRTGLIGARRLSPDGYPLWMLAVRLAADARLTWDRHHGEEAVYVLSGSLQIHDAGGAEKSAGRRCGRGGALVVESAAAPSVVAEQPSEVLVMGTVDAGARYDGPLGPPLQPGSRTHLIGPLGTAQWERAPSKLTRYYANSTCPGCRVTLMYSACSQHYRSAVHSHSSDELIHVTAGRIRIGSRWAGIGDTVAVPANTRYRFETGDDGYGFLNYRPDACYYRATDGTELLEVGNPRDFVFTGDGRDYLSEDEFRRAQEHAIATARA